MKNYAEKGLNGLRDEALRIAREHGFIEATPGEELMLMVTELAEAMEDVRRGQMLDDLYFTNTPNGEKPCGVPSEMADVVIRVMHFCGKHGIDIAEAINAKMAYNEGRPFMHGKKL